MYDNFDDASGVSFLPHTDHTYAQAPYQEMTEQELDAWCAAHPMPASIDWRELAEFERDDNTTGSQELACVGGACELP